MGHEDKNLNFSQGEVNKIKSCSILLITDFILIILELNLCHRKLSHTSKHNLLNNVKSTRV